MENPDNSYITSFKELNQWLKSNVDNSLHNYVLIDEVQEIFQFEKTLRYWVKNENVDIIVTGSNAKMLSGDIASAFAGRYLQVHTYSLSYAEFLQFYQMEPSDSSLSTYFRWGGLPYLKNIPLDDTRDRTDYLDSIYNTIFVKDIVTRHDIRNSSFIDNLARFLADSTGKIFSPYSISKLMKGKGVLISSNTVAEYSEILSESFMIDKVKRFDLKGKKIFEQQEKYYFEDIGVRNFLSGGNVLSSLEKILENVTYLKLKGLGWDVYIGQYEDKEIDFVAKKGEEIEYYQVSVSLSAKETFDREIGNLKLIKDNYPKYIVTFDTFASGSNVDGIKIINVGDFLLNGCRN